MATGGAAAAAGGAGAATAGGIAGVVGTKVGVGLTSAVLLAGAAEVKHQVDKTPNGNRANVERTDQSLASVAPAPIADPSAANPEATPVDPNAPVEGEVPVVPVDPNAPPGTVDPNAPALTNGGVLPGSHKGKRKRRKHAMADSYKPAPNPAAANPASPTVPADDKGPGEEVPTVPPEGEGGTGGTGGDTTITPPTTP
jgi:hypothetical protein